MSKDARQKNYFYNKDGNQLPPEQKNYSFIKEAFIFLWEIAKVVIISLVIILPIRYFLIQPFYVKGASMEPNFQDHEYLIIDQISYRFHEPMRGDVIVFRYPIDPSNFFIKRIIGLPGETVRIRDGNIIIFNKQRPDGQNLHEPYLPEGVKTLSMKETASWTLGKDEYFLMGDNRSESMDSRTFGTVARKSVIGRVFLRGWPLNKISIFNQSPQYGM